MFVPNKLNTTLFRATVAVNGYLQFNHVKYFNKKKNTLDQRSSILMEMITNKDKRNNWHFNILSDKPKARLFEKIHKPHRRQSVLNSLFIKNITDVISTGDVVPGLTDYGVEITGVRISPCCKLLNVFWQVPASRYNSCEDIGNILTIAAPKIRAELISRNILGRVPYIFFLRDVTNEKIATFETAMEKLEMEIKSDPAIVVDDSFMKDLYSFKTSKVERKKFDEEISHDTKEGVSHSDKDNTKAEYPEKPVMRCDIFGLDHAQMMQKVIALKKKNKEPPVKTAVISPDKLNGEDDLFEKIPGTRFEVASSRNDILKKFQITRKILTQKKKEKVPVDDYQSQESHTIEDTIDINDIELTLCKQDFIDDESTENSH